MTRRDVINELIDLVDSIYRASEIDRPVTPRDLDVIRQACARTIDRIDEEIEAA